MIKIITDSAADIEKEYAKKHNVHIVPLHVSFQDEEFLDGEDLSPLEFYGRLIESDVLPKTSQISPFEFEKVFDLYNDMDILCITLSSKLSGTCQSANIAACERENVRIIDSLNATVGEKVLVELAVKLVEDGKNIDEIESILNNKKKDIRLVAVLDTLEYLKKGGRISSLTASVGTLLQIKPVVEVQNGEVVVVGKARGSRNGNNKLREITSRYGIDFDLPFQTAFSGISNYMLLKYIEDSKDLYPENKNIPYTRLGSTIGTHIGPGAIAVAFFGKNN